MDLWNSCKCVAPRAAVTLAAGVILTGLLTGCAHETATTSVHANGSWSRKSVFSMAEDDKGKGAKKVALRDVFTPPSGAGWKVEQKKTNEEPKQWVVTAWKEVGAAETIVGDLTVKSAAKTGPVPARVVNSATVRAAGAGRWAYTETFHWMGSKPAIDKDMDPLIGPSLKKSMPAGMATDANARLLGRRLKRTLWKTLFSPPEPLALDFYDNLLPIPGLSDPEERAGVLVRRLGPGIETALQETFGDRLPAERRHQTAINLARQISEDTGLNAGKGDKMGGSAGKGSGMDDMTESFGGMYPAAITLVLKAPGHVVETNGIVDDLTGEVYWTLYPQAALEQDVTLRAVFEAGKQTVMK